MSSSIYMVMVFSGVSFIVYGISCLASKHMKQEFDRYRIPQFRAMIGWLQLAAGICQVLVKQIPQLALIASVGLALMMFAGILVRIRIRDSIIQMTPAAFYLAANFYLVADYFVGV